MLFRKQSLSFCQQSSLQNGKLSLHVSFCGVNGKGIQIGLGKRSSSEGQTRVGASNAENSCVCCAG
eukprot:5970712-Pleurochrysis_carterae.AAC.2